MQVALPSRMAANTRRVLRRALSDCSSIGVIAQLSSVKDRKAYLNLFIMHMYIGPVSISC